MLPPLKDNVDGFPQTCVFKKDMSWGKEGIWSSYSSPVSMGHMVSTPNHPRLQGYIHRTSELQNQ